MPPTCFFHRRRRAPTDDESIASFFARRFGSEAVDYLAEPLLATIHAGNVDRLSMRALFPRLLEAEQRGSLIRAFRRLRPRPSPDGMFRSLPGGLGELVVALSAALPSERLLRRAAVTSIEGEGPYCVRAGQTSTTAAAVILAIPAPAAARLLDQRDPLLAARCREIRHASTATVALSYPRANIQHPLSGSGFVVPRVEHDISIIAASWVSSKWPGRAPAGQVLLRAFIGGARDPETLERAQLDAQLAELAHRDLAHVLGITGSPRLTRVYRWPQGSPQHDVGHLQRVEAIETQLERWPGLFVTGSSFRSVGIPDCVQDGRATAGTAAAYVNRVASG